jgi:transposase
VAVDGANRHDMKLFKETIDKIEISRPIPNEEHKQGMCLDKGYDYEEIRKLVEAFGFTAHIKSRGQEAEEIKREAGKRARRWVVERTHSWMNRFRGILIRWNKKAEAYIAMLHLTCGIITWKATGLLG